MSARPPQPERKITGGDPSALFDLAVKAFAEGRAADACRQCKILLEVAPDDRDVLHLYAAAAAMIGDTPAAIAASERLIKLSPDHAEGRRNLGALLASQKRHAEARLHLEAAAKLAPAHIGGRLMLVRSLRALGALDPARAEAESLAQQAPDNAEAQFLLGNLRLTSGDQDGALRAFARALALRPDHVETLVNLSVTLRASNRREEARLALRRALALQPGLASAHFNLGTLALDGGACEEAIRHYRAALESGGDPVGLHRSIGLAYLLRSDRDAAIAEFKAALAAAPEDPDTLVAMGDALSQLRLMAEATDCFRRALATAPHHPQAIPRLFNQALQCCDWDEAQRLKPMVDALTDEALAKGEAPAEAAFLSLAHAEDPARHGAIARAMSAQAARRAGPPLVLPERPQDANRRIKLGYVSADFRNHAVSQLLVRTLELHDRSQFEVWAYSTGAEDRSALRERVRDGVDAFIDIRELDHRAAAERIAKDRVDILIELTLHTTGARLEIAALRPAPIQMGWLGFPGSSGADYFDYLLTDKIVTPPDQAPHYSEKLAYLPETFQPNDDRQPIAAGRPTRAEYGLPEDGIVFCSFNQAYKIEPVLFDLWMGLLRDLPKSVLWLHRINEVAPVNLRREAAKRGVAPERLVFADRPEKPAHLRRLALADLALDTRLYNGHTTSSDALWAGVPVLTMLGSHYAARVSASVLNAIGLPDLVAADLEGYRAIALKLARDPAALANVKARLARNRSTMPLFDSPRFTRHLEAVYRAAWARHEAGLAADLIELAVPAPRAGRDG
jgi:predicted O-linked N-acetylglucosamine transferase (SPINDLY family)